MEITQEKYDNIIKMLKSPDESNQILGLTILNELSFSDNITKILLILKHSNTNIGLLQKHAPGLYVDLSDLKELDLKKHITYKHLLNTLIVNKVSAEQIEFYMNDFSKYLLNQIQAMGYDYIDDIHLSIKLKKND